MKLPLPAIVVFLFLPAHWRTPLHRLRPNSVCATKKPASLAGFRFLILGISRLTPSFSSRDPHFTHPSLPSVTYSNSKLPITRA